MFSRLGVMVGFMFSDNEFGKGKLKEIDDYLTLTGFKKGESEKVDGREADVVTFLAQISIKEDKAAVKVWIDSETGLPVKRSITPYRDGKPSEDEMLETYVKITLDAEIPEDRFALPSEEPEKKEK
jgi:outer membrane lipoprotein-sorting protein